jgi:biotin synthase
MPWLPLAERSIAGDALTRDEARAVLHCPDDELLALLDATFRVRRAFHGKKVRIHVLQNAKSGACPEDCRFCSQSSFYGQGVAAAAATPRQAEPGGAPPPAGEYPLQSVEEIVEGARRAKRARAWKYCIVTATRGPSKRDLDVVCEAVRRIKSEMDLTICTSLGLLTEDKAKRLAEAGVDRYNHNLESSERFFPEVATTHAFADRVATVKLARGAGMEACCGGIVGMGESEDDVLDLAYALRELQVESVPVNFLDPRPGTPMAQRARTTPAQCLKTLCLFRLLHPRADLRAAGGREANLRWMQPMALYAVNSIFTQGYLTTPGAAPSEDHRMILDLGFEIEEVRGENGEAKADGPDQSRLHAHG